METEAQVEIRVENTSNNENVNCDEIILNKTIGADNVNVTNEFVGEVVTSDNENLPKHQKITTAECLLDENQLDNMAIIHDDEFTRVEDAKTAIPAREQLIEDCESKKSDRLSDTKDSLSPDDKSKLKSTDVVSTISNAEDLSQTEQNCDPSKDVFTNAESTQPTSTDTQQNYSDKTVEESVNNAQPDLIKIENDSNQTKDFQTATKVSETDSLILTADDELETEMTMTDKNDKPQNEKSAMDNSTCKSLKLSEPVSDDFNEIDVNGGNDRECNLNNDENLTALTNTNRTDFSDDDNNDEKISNDDGKIIKNDNKSNSKKVGEDSTRKSKTVWISNISSSAKAADLKQFVSKIGKVVTAKVVTDGKNCYGYIVMNSIETASECVKKLNNEYFENHKICVSFTQPCSGTSNRKSAEREKSKLLKRRESHKLGLIKEGESKTSKRKCSSRTVKRRSKSTSNSWSSRIRRRSSIDPLTTKYKSCRDCHRHSRQKSRSRDRQLREERDRRRYLDEQRRQRDEIRRRIEKEEKQKAMEYKLEQDHKKLRLEIEQFEKERRMEREKIEKERLDILRQKMKLTEECSKIQASSHAKKESYGNASFDRFKNFERDAPPPPKLSSELKRRSSVFVGAFGGETVPSQLYKPPKRRTSPFSSTFSGIIDEPPKIFKQRKYVNKYKGRDCSMSNRQPFPERDIRGEDKILNKTPMSNVPSSYQVKKKIDDLNFQSYLKDFDLNHKSKQSDRKYDCSELKLDGKSERGGEAHKIEVIDRKYYVDRNNDDGSRKHRKPDFEDRKPPYTDRKYDYNRDMKRYRSEHYFDREHNPRTDVPPNVNNYNETWKTGLSNPVATTSTGRFEDNNFSSSYLPSRIVPDFYQSSLSTGLGDYRYDHCQQATGRKY